jgi:hypothetical protein
MEKEDFLHQSICNYFSKQTEIDTLKSPETEVNSKIKILSRNI